MNKEVYKKALDKFGVKNQIYVAIEELSELIKELTKYLRGNFDGANLVDELADVEIVTKQIIQMFDVGEAVEKRTVTKINRLDKRISDEKS